MSVWAAGPHGSHTLQLWPHQHTRGPRHLHVSSAVQANRLLPPHPSGGSPISAVSSALHHAGFKAQSHLRERSLPSRRGCGLAKGAPAQPQAAAEWERLRSRAEEQGWASCRAQPHLRSPAGKGRSQPHMRRALRDRATSPQKGEPAASETRTCHFSGAIQTELKAEQLRISVLLMHSLPTLRHDRRAEEPRKCWLRETWSVSTEGESVLPGSCTAAFPEHDLCWGHRELSPEPRQGCPWPDPEPKGLVLLPLLQAGSCPLWVPGQLGGTQLTSALQGLPASLCSSLAHWSVVTSHWGHGNVCFFVPTVMTPK